MSDDVVIVDSDAIWPADAADVEEAVVANWFVREGAEVEEGDTLCEIQIEKVGVDVPAPASGALERVLLAEGEEFTRGDAIAEIRPA